MTGPELLWAVVGAVALVAVFVVQRKTRFMEKSERFMGDLAGVSESTPGWLAFFKLLWMWAANAAACLFLWMLAVPGSSGGETFYRLGWFLLIGNAAAIVVTGTMFATGRRAGAVRSAKWIVPVLFAVLIVYALFGAIVN